MPATPHGITLRRAAERGHTQLGWLDSWHSFSFGEYHDPDHMGFRSLRVINDDRVAPGRGFGEHGHRDMEILTWVLDGALAHKDSLGHTSTLHPGDAQVMTAGSGIRHSEFNGSQQQTSHFLQIWLLPEAKGLEPRYEEKSFPVDARQNQWCLIASPDGRAGSTRMHQDAHIYASLLASGAPLTLDLEARSDLATWLHIARGSVDCAGVTLEAGDAMAITAADPLRITARTDAELLRFDLA